MPAAIEEKLRERERGRAVGRGVVAGCVAVDSPSVSSGVGGAAKEAYRIEMKPTTCDVPVAKERDRGGGRAVGGGARVVGVGPAFFPPSAPIPRAKNRTRPTVEDLIRQVCSCPCAFIGAYAHRCMLACDAYVDACKHARIHVHEVLVKKHRHCRCSSRIEG